MTAKIEQYNRNASLKATMGDKSHRKQVSSFTGLQQQIKTIDPSPGGLTYYNPQPVYQEYYAELGIKSPSRQMIDTQDNFGNAEYTRYHFSTYQQPSAQPQKKKPKQLESAIPQSNSMRALKNKSKVYEKQDSAEDVVTLAYVEMQTTPLEELRKTNSEANRIKLPRNAGGKKEYDGKVFKGTSMSNNGWDPIEFGRPRSSLGFGKAEIRFQEDKLAERYYQPRDAVPGPGQYFKSNEFIGKDKSESYSKKGYGNGFLSKLRRFKDGKDFGYFVQLPGPGSYDAPQVAQADSSQSFNSRNGVVQHNNSTSVFASVVPRKIDTPYTESPGPGAYQTRNFTESSPIRHDMRKSSSNEKLIKLQNQFHTRKSVPSIPSFKKSFPSNSTIAGLTAFETYHPKGMSQRNNHQSQTTLDNTQMRKQDPVSSLKQILQKALQESSKTVQGQFPGPGAYQQAQQTISANSLIKYSEGVMQTHILKNREEQKMYRQQYLKKRKEGLPEMELKMLERKSPNKEEPGPGTYNIEIKNNKKEIKSVFKSQTAREVMPIVKASPGPAYYFNNSRFEREKVNMKL